MTKRTALDIANTIINDLHRFPERREAAAMLRAQHAEIARLAGEIESASRRAEFWKAEHLAGNKEIARLQRIIASRPLADGSYTFDASSYDSLNDGEPLVLTIPFTATDENAAVSSVANLVITITGTNDVPVAVTAVTAVAEDLSRLLP